MNFSGYNWTVRSKTPQYDYVDLKIQIFDFVIDDCHVCVAWYADHTYGWWKYGEQGKTAKTLQLAVKQALNSIGIWTKDND